MKTKEKIEKLADEFFEFPKEQNRLTVTFTSAKLFAEYVLDKMGSDTTELVDLLNEVWWESNDWERRRVELLKRIK